uniref:Tubulin epsilon and delta complex protein 1 domain-containing protein n=1 Tax=Physcomitrium patens TaxID=3218 RepID=A0A2K1KCN3_PHYPA|nr:hypothetical protein PHYPA_010732 [Physcomitrium patens]
MPRIEHEFWAATRSSIFNLEIHACEISRGKNTVLANMESKVQNERKVSVKKSMRYVSELITDLGVRGIAPENLRLAKFNKLESPGYLLRALHDIITLRIAGFPAEKDVAKKIARSQSSSIILRCSNASTTAKSQKELRLKEVASSISRIVCEDEYDGDNNLAVVKFHLALWGYSPHSPFFLLHADTSNSRHFLLALGWLISECNLIERGLKRRLQPLQADRSMATLPHDYPLDMACSPEGLCRARKAECASVDYVRRMLAATERVDDEVLRTEMRTDQVLMLHGQVGLNAIEALQVTKVNKLHELQLAQLAAGVKVLHTPYQLHLLQHREKLDIHCQAIAAAKAIADEKEACEHHEYLFWQWMESVALEELAEKPQSKCSREEPPTVDLIGVTEADLLPAIEHLKLKLTACEQDVEGGTSSSGLSALSESFKRTMSKDDVNPHKENDTSWQYAKNMAVGLLRQPVFVFTPEKKPEIRNHKVALRNKEESDPQSALYKMKKLMEVNEIVTGTLARIRAENKTSNPHGKFVDKILSKTRVLGVLSKRYPTCFSEEKSGCWHEELSSVWTKLG